MFSRIKYYGFLSSKYAKYKITAKYSCANNPSALSHNSVNVKGLISSSVITSSLRGSNHLTDKWRSMATWTLMSTMS